MILLSSFHSVLFILEVKASNSGILLVFKGFWSIVDIVKCYHFIQFTGRKLGGGEIFLVSGRGSPQHRMQFPVAWVCDALSSLGAFPACSEMSM